MRCVALFNLVVFFVLLLTGALPAQSGVSATFVSTTEMRTTVNVQKKASVPANTDWTKGLTLSIKTVVNGNRVLGYADAKTVVQFRHSPTLGTVVSISDTSAAGGHNPWMRASTGLSSPREHVTRLVFKSAKPIKARLILNAEWSGVGYAAWTSYKYYASVRLCNSVVFSTGKPGKKSKEFSVIIDATGLVLQTSTYSNATNLAPFFPRDAYATGILTIRLLPTIDCTATPYGIGCGPLLIGAPTFKNELELQLTKAAPLAFGQLIIGLKPLSIRIPGVSCYLNTDILLLLPFMTNSAGQATHVLPVPPSLKLIFNLQDVLFQKRGNSFVITSTNGLRVNCK